MADGDSEWNRDHARADYDAEYHVATEVHVSTPDYALLTHSMGSPCLLKGEIPFQLQASGIWDATAAPATHLSQFPHLRSSLRTEVGETSTAPFMSNSSIGLTSAAAVPRFESESADILMPSPLAIRGDKTVLDHMEPHPVLCNFNQSDNATPLIASRTRPSKKSPPSNPPVIVGQLPPVPDSIPRDPVPQAGRGEGWPYAPQGWPKADDKWGWRVGKRASSNSLWIDRYVILPISLLKSRRPGKPAEFASRRSFSEYFKQNFPEIDPDSIFKAFDWKVPAPKSTEDNEAFDKRGSGVKRDKPSSTDGDDGWQKLKKQCRAGNPDCLLVRGKGGAFESLESLVCHICCSEPGFCCECKCILCCETFLPDADEVSIIRCRNFPVSGDGICGHASHLECALTSQLAGSIKKNGLDMEYMCRRCDRRMDLRETFTRLVEVLSKTVMRSKVENSLQLALRIVQDPDDEARSPGKVLATLIEDALRKVRLGADIGEVYNELTKQRLGLQPGQLVYASEVSHQVQNGSGAMGPKSTLEGSQHPTETSLDKLLSPLRSSVSCDASIILPTLISSPHVQRSPTVSTRQSGWNDTCPASNNPSNALMVWYGDSQADGVATTRGKRLQYVPSMDMKVPRTSIQDFPKPEGQIMSSVVLQTPSDILTHTTDLSSLIHQSVSRPPTLSIQEHIRQCEAMANRVRGAAELNTPFSMLSEAVCGEPEVVPTSDSKPPSFSGGSSTAEIHDSQPPASQVVNPSAEASHYTRESGIASIPSSCNPRSPSLFKSQEAGECIANTDLTEVPRIELSTIPTSKREPDVADADGLESEYEDQIIQALEKLRKAQAAEYACAEKYLHAQKRTIIEHYLQLGNVCGDIAKNGRVKLSPKQVKKDLSKSITFTDRAMNRPVDQVGKMQEGEKIFESMLNISNGFGQASKEFLREFFNWPPTDIAES
ncbi:uncharacterized protein [Physcomitrium patens]|uniref:Uncharacterized protein n=1 Tax=Physcomitrium patens TaxID=3218 RepID=A0A2K1JCJ3_PHYPA|nr:uncharacterized protein LOC112292560 isoform X2 [Physcomitrium patens]PNR39247.1 hypothetical protein PHYPA_019525 [Physcomitrium patens]|eukprot:XP_024396925.1 uncharacterized protein LOC112292560 isoform X2 [Physcomitrella patens]